MSLGAMCTYSNIASINHKILHLVQKGLPYHPPQNTRILRLAPLISYHLGFQCLWSPGCASPTLTSTASMSTDFLLPTRLPDVQPTHHVPTLSCWTTSKNIFGKSNWSTGIVTFKGSTSSCYGRGQAAKMQSIGCQSGTEYFKSRFHLKWVWVPAIPFIW